MSDGTMRCHGCREDHDDYEKVAKYAINGSCRRGYAHVYECGRCGEHTEVLTP